MTLNCQRFGWRLSSAKDEIVPQRRKRVNKKEQITTKKQQNVGIKISLKG